MDEYIKKEDVYQHLDNEVEWKVNQDRLYALEVINDFPAAEVAEVRHGRWLKRSDGTPYCSNCGANERDTYSSVVNECAFCYSCGARMDKEDEHEAG